MRKGVGGEEGRRVDLRVIRPVVIIVIRPLVSRRVGTGRDVVSVVRRPRERVLHLIVVAAAHAPTPHTRLTQLGRGSTQTPALARAGIRGWRSGSNRQARALPPCSRCQRMRPHNLNRFRLLPTHARGSTDSDPSKPPVPQAAGTGSSIGSRTAGDGACMQATPGQGKRVNLRGGVVEEAHRAVSALPRGEGSGGIPGGRRDRRRLLAEIRQHLMRPAHHARRNPLFQWCAQAPDP